MYNNGRLPINFSIIYSNQRCDIVRIIRFVRMTSHKMRTFATTFGVIPRNFSHREFISKNDRLFVREFQPSKVLTLIRPEELMYHSDTAKTYPKVQIVMLYYIHGADYESTIKSVRASS